MPFFFCYFSLLFVTDLVSLAVITARVPANFVVNVFMPNQQPSNGKFGTYQSSSLLHFYNHFCADQKRFVYVFTCVLFVFARFCLGFCLCFSALYHALLKCSWIKVD